MPYKIDVPITLYTQEEMSAVERELLEVKYILCDLIRKLSDEVHSNKGIEKILTRDLQDWRNKNDDR